MAQEKNNDDIVLVSGPLQPLGKKANIPLAQKITAQVVLSRERSDILLAQKATDLVLKEAKNDLPKYLPMVLINEMEILSDHLKKISSKAELIFDDSAEELSEMIERLYKLLFKNFPQGIDVIAKDSTINSGAERGVFEIHVRNFIEQYFFFSMKREYSDFEKLSDEVDFALSLRKMVQGKEEIKSIDTVIWKHHLSRYTNGLIEDVIYPIFSNRIDYSSPVEPDYDPEYVRYKYGKLILFSFICNPIYQNEDINQKARHDLWLCNVFDRAVKSSEGVRKDEEEVFDKTGEPKLKSLLIDFLLGKIQREALAIRIIAIKKEMRKSQKE